MESHLTGFAHKSLRLCVVVLALLLCLPGASAVIGFLYFSCMAWEKAYAAHGIPQNPLLAMLFIPEAVVICGWIVVFFLLYANEPYS